jgi:hypothetical protein
MLKKVTPNVDPRFAQVVEAFAPEAHRFVKGAKA